MKLSVEYALVSVNVSRAYDALNKRKTEWSLFWYVCLSNSFRFRNLLSLCVNFVAYMIEAQVMVCGRSLAAMAVSLPFITSAFTKVSLLLVLITDLYLILYCAILNSVLSNFSKKKTTTFFSQFVLHISILV